ncbi:hypothetical protein ACB092_09G180700 [Castanea dentata]
MKFTCDFCGKEGNLPFLCVPCSFGIHTSCAACLPTVKVTRHEHPLQLIHSLEIHQSNSRICLLCVKKVDTRWVYYCSICDFIAHLRCGMNPRNREYINLQELVKERLHQSVDSATYEVKKFNVGEDRTKIATEIKYFSHEHVLKLTNEVLNNTKCDGCVRDFLPPFYGCTRCNFFLHKSCVELPKIKRHPLHRHPLTLNYWSYSFCCAFCGQECNGLRYNCQLCNYDLNV